MTTRASAHAHALAPALALALSLAPTLARADAPWEEISRKDGVTVERRPRPGSSFYELRAQATLPIAAEDFAATLWNFRAYPAFVPYLKSLTVLADDARAATLYQQISMPMVDDRDYTVRWVREPSPDGRATLLRFDSATGLGPPPRGDHVRAQNIHGSWLLEPTSDGKSTRVTYSLYSEPGGSLPTWIVNLASRDAPRDLLLAMAKRAAARRTPSN